MKGLPIHLKVNLLIALALAVVMGGHLYLEISIEQADIERMLLKQAQSMFHHVNDMRHWSSGLGGVYVFKKEGMEVNPYLDKARPAAGDAPVEPVITDSKGRELILKDPALMAREVAASSKRDGHIIYHMSSLNPINPGNLPNDFEKRALTAFGEGRQELFSLLKRDEKYYFQYMGAVKTEKSCLKCHGFQGYRVGDVRGGISIEIPADEELAHLAEHRRYYIFYTLFAFFTIVMAIFICLRLYVFRPLARLVEFSEALEEDGDTLVAEESRDEMSQLVSALNDARKRIRSHEHDLKRKNEALDHARRVDPLTRAFNRQHFLLEAPTILARAEREKTPTSILMIDIDLFKEINDRHGHIIGDKVLKGVVKLLKGEIRSYDLLVRHGGEEFLVLMPNTDNSMAIDVAERIRRRVASACFEVEEDICVKSTVSIGVYTTSEQDIRKMLWKADEAMYQAKKGGRNRLYNMGK